jgi:hypothetical protein
MYSVNAGELRNPMKADYLLPMKTLAQNRKISICVDVASERHLRHRPRKKPRCEKKASPRNAKSKSQNHSDHVDVD